MSTNRTILYALLTSLLSLCFSGAVIASQRLSESQIAARFVLDNSSLSSLYQHPTIYLWLDKQGLNSQAYDALEFIANSASHGLDPDDYHFELLQQLDAALDPEFDEVDSHLFDLALTDGLLQLIRDISVGRLDPGVVDPKWSIPRAPFDATEFLRQALVSGQFSNNLNSLIPNSESYRKLNAAAIRYQGYIDRGGWSKIPIVTTHRAGDTHNNIVAIRERIAFEEPAMDSPRPSMLDYYDDALKQAVQGFQRRHSLEDDGVIGPATIRAMNVPAEHRLRQISINMERLRWLPDDLGDRYIMVNLANYRLKAIEHDEVHLDMKVIVGKSKRSTPSFSSKMTHVIMNPKWYVPHKLARLDLLPKQKKNPDYFDRSNIRVFDLEGGKKTEISSSTVDWQTVSEDDFHYSLVQEPGAKNALGRMKFILPNPWRIYLHDTPSKNLFNRSKRNFSSGCIRVEDPDALAGFSLRGNSLQTPLTEILSSNANHSTELEQPLPVYAIYATVWPRGDELIFSPDSYARDQVMAKYL